MKQWWESKFPVLIKIKNNKTGEIREYKDEEYIVDGEWSSYMWSSGNYSCDCNRELFFERAADLSIENIPICGDSRFSIVSIFDINKNEIIYAEPFCKKDCIVHCSKCSYRGDKIYKYCDDCFKILGGKAK